MSVWQRIGDFLGSFSERTGVAGSLANALDPDNWLPGGHDAAFTIALVALIAKMAVADGVVTNSEIRKFHDLVEVPATEAGQVDRLFDLAQQDVAGYQSYARKVGRLFSDNPDTLEHVLDALFQIAAADGMIHEQEFDYLKSVSDIFGFDEPLFEQIAAQHILSERGRDPYRVLGLSPTANFEEVRRVHRKLVREHHPDRLIAKGVPEEMLGIATARMAAINAAFDEIAERQSA